MGVKLRYAFGSVYPLLANQTSESLDPSKYWWGLTWNALLDLDNLNQEQEQKLYVDFQKAQYSLLHVLSENFGTHEKQRHTISATVTQVHTDSIPSTLFEKSMSRFSDLQPQALERKMKQAKAHLHPQRGQHAKLPPKSTRP